MRIEALSIRAVTVGIFVMIGVVAIVLSLLAGSYFRQAALDAQMHSLSRVIEVAAQEMLKKVRGYTFDLGMRLAHSDELIAAMQQTEGEGRQATLVALLDDPFENGFVGFANINLEKIRVFDQELNLVAQSSQGSALLDAQLAPYLRDVLMNRSGVDRLKAVDALWLSAAGPMHSTLVPIGGLRLIGYMEVVINPVFNLPDIGKITHTPISIFSVDGKPILDSEGRSSAGHLPIEYIMPTSKGEPAFRVVGYEDVRTLNREMEQTQWVTTSGFLALSISTLLFALWLFNRFLFVPVRRMTAEMRKMAQGNLDLTINKKGLRDFSILAETFAEMASQVRSRTNELERLLDLDDSAILCFGTDGEVVYLNRRACDLFGYSQDEVNDLDMNELFVEDVARQMPGAERTGEQQVHVRLTGIRKDGSRFDNDAVIRPLHSGGSEGVAIVLNEAPEASGISLPEDVLHSFRKSEQRMDAVEQSLNSLLELARTGSGLGVGEIDDGARGTTLPVVDHKLQLREQTVKVMLAALACWERDLDKSKLDLAEESGIWPVYIDKSTPTTRTLDKYLNLDSCPKHPRTQRVIDTAEFVLRQLGRKTTTRRAELQAALNDFRLLVSGIRQAGN